LRKISPIIERRPVDGTAFASLFGDNRFCVNLR